MLSTGPFVSSIVTNSKISFAILPAIIFVVAAFLSFSMGTAWGTFGILIPIVVPICKADGGDPYLVISLAATLAGSVYGDHCSPISDTTILSSTGARCEHIRHVETQIPYATLVAVICFIGYLIGGITLNPWITLVASMIILLAALSVINMVQKKNKKS